MPRAADRDRIYYRRRYTPEVIELCVRWYVTYRLSYRDISAMMAERDISVSRTTILRWVQRYVPEFERRGARFAKPINSSWRVTKPPCPFKGDGITSIERSIATESPYIRSYQRTGP